MNAIQDLPRDAVVSAAGAMAVRSRLGLVGCWHETNTYSARRADRKAFEDFELLSGQALIDRHTGTNSIFGGALEAAETRGWSAVPIFSARAWPSGPADRATARALLGELSSALAAAPRVDAIVLAVHGAMVADGHDDMDLDVLRTVRSRYGNIPVAAVLDLHANPSHAFCRSAQIVLGFRTYPHADMADRGREAVQLCDEQHRGARWTTSSTKLPILSTPLAQGTDDQPLRSLRALADQLADVDGVGHVAVFPGFAYADVARAGFTITITSDRRRGRPPEDLALTRAVRRLADQLVLQRPTPAQAISDAAQRARTRTAPVALVDVADNIGAGGAGDGTALLDELLAQRVAGSIVTLADPLVAAGAAQIGESGHFRGYAGARTDALHGMPVLLDAVVERVWDGRYTASGSWLTGQEFNLGTSVLLCTASGVRVAVTTTAVPPFHREQLTGLGIDPAAASILTFKGAIAWQADYRDLVADVIEADTPGVCPLDPWTLPRRHTPATA